MVALVIPYVQHKTEIVSTGIKIKKDGISPVFILFTLLIAKLDS